MRSELWLDWITSSARAALHSELWLDWIHGVYQVSNRGRVRRVEASRTTKAMHILSPHEDLGTGYMFVGLRDPSGKRKTYLLHRVVARVWHGEAPDGFEVNHKNGVRSDCRACNLEYVTHAYNIQDSIDRRRASGKRGPADKLTPSKVQRIRRMLASGATQTALARHYSLHKTTIGCIARGETWTHVP